MPYRYEKSKLLAYSGSRNKSRKNLNVDQDSK